MTNEVKEFSFDVLYLDVVDQECHVVAEVEIRVLEDDRVAQNRVALDFVELARAQGSHRSRRSPLKTEFLVLSKVFIDFHELTRRPNLNWFHFVRSLSLDAVSGHHGLKSLTLGDQDNLNHEIGARLSVECRITI